MQGLSKGRFHESFHARGLASRHPVHCAYLTVVIASRAYEHVAVFEMDADKCGAGDVADPAWAGGDVLQDAPTAGEQGEPAFTRQRRER
jgi:hypothetical protein